MKSKKVRLLILGLVCIAVAGLLVATVVRYQYSLGIDAISYVSIARQYSEGLFGSAINAYWSPMVSWLMVPFLWLKIEGSVAFLIVNALTSLFILVFGMFYVGKATGRNFFAVLLYALAVFPFLLDSTRVLTPDLLVVAWILIFIAILHYIHRNNARPLWQKALLLGLVGVLGYVIKLYLVPVFMVSVLVWGAVRVLSRKGSVRKKELLKLGILPLAGLGCAFILSLPWATALSIKYEHFTFGSSFAVNMESKFDKNANDSTQLTSLEAPPNEHAVAIGEDRTPSKEQQNDGNETSSESGSLKDKLQYYIGERLKALPYYLNRISSIWPFTMPILLILGIAILLGFLTYQRYTATINAWMLAVVYFVGYAAITSTSSGGGNGRYYWPVFILALVALCTLLPKLWDHVAHQRQKPRMIIFIIVIALLPLISISHYIVGIQYTNSIPISNPVGIGASERSTTIDSLFKGGDKSQIYQLAERIRNDNIIPKGSKLVGDNYRMMVRIAYYLESQVYGRSGDGNYYNLSNPERELKEKGIEYVITFTPKGERSRNIVEGEVLGRYTYMGSCLDKKGSHYEECQIEVIKLEP